MKNNLSINSILNVFDFPIIVCDSFGRISFTNNYFKEYFLKNNFNITHISEINIFENFKDILSMKKDIEIEYKGQIFKVSNHNINDNIIITFESCDYNQIYNIYKKIINTINESVAVCDLEGNLIVFNDANERFENLLKRNVLGKNITDLYDLDKKNSLLFKTMNSGKPLLNQHQIYTTFSGNRIDVMVDTYPLYEGKKIIGAVSIMRDYTKIKELSSKILDLQDELIGRKKTNNQSKPLNAKYHFEDIVGNSPILLKTIELSKKAATSDSPILIYGETGTGKELFAQSIHNYSNYKKGPFIAINCAAIPDNLLEGLLFGTVKGAFSDSVNRAGLFEQAQNGTLVLDELNSMSLNLQSKLLRVLQENLIRRVGGTQEISINTRIISIINTPPLQAVEENKLRQDLYYRLSVINIKTSSLRDRKEDIPLFINHFSKKYSKLMKKRVNSFSNKALNIFLNYNWPGNVRELEHAVEYGVNMIEPEINVINEDLIPEHIKNNFYNNQVPKGDIVELETFMNQKEKKYLIKALKKNNWNVTQTAKALNIKRQSLQYRMNKYDINKEE